MEDKKIKKERRVGEFFIGKYNRKYNMNFALETEGQRLRREDPPDLIFYDNNRILNIEVVGLWDSADQKTEINRKKRGGIGSGRIITTANYYCNLAKEEILRKNFTCEILLIDGYQNQWTWETELKNVDNWLIEDCDIQLYCREFFNEVWIIDGNKIARNIFQRDIGKELK